MVEVYGGASWHGDILKLQVMFASNQKCHIAKSYYLLSLNSNWIYMDMIFK